MRRLNAVAAVACAFALSISAANAKPKQARIASQEAGQCVYDNSGRVTCPPAGKRIQRRARVRGGTIKSYRRASVSRGCLTSDTRATLEQAEAHFGVTFKLVSTCRPGARIAGTNHISEHAHGRAVDLMVPRGVSKQAVVRWLYANAKGVTMVYRGMAHVHFDTGPYHTLACGGCRKPRHDEMARHP